MAHFAKIENGKVVEVIAINNDAIEGGNYPESESVGQQFIASLGLDGFWLQTSYNDNIRHRFAGVGYSYDAQKDIFIPPQPFPSWLLSPMGDWTPPLPEPNDGHRYIWNEATQNWEKREEEV